MQALPQLPVRREVLLARAHAVTLDLLRPLGAGLVLHKIQISHVIGQCGCVGTGAIR